MHVYFCPLLNLIKMGVKTNEKGTGERTMSKKVNMWGKRRNS